LGNILNIVFGALSEATIEQLDICNNEVGNYGARLLSKGLQMNTSIKVLALDRNQINADGFAELAHALVGFCVDLNFLNQTCYKKIYTKIAV
jgi:Ran GTPase-activating protein (RanGAP) involved in mRNA processing and transport